MRGKERFSDPLKVSALITRFSAGNAWSLRETRIRAILDSSEFL
jgi:hypothetical protein